MSKKKIFDFCLGNPPYNSDFDEQGNQKKFASPVYNIFMDATFRVADKVELITPARFLFNAGATPEEWNLQRLDDPHFKVLEYSADASKVFPSTDIKGGVAITYRDETKDFGAIGVYTAFEEHGSILKKVKELMTESMAPYISGRGVYQLSEKALREHPEIENIQSKGHKFDIGTGVFKILNDVVFFEKKPKDNSTYIKILGLTASKRNYQYIREDYVKAPESLYNYKVFIPKSNGSGAIGEVLSTPLVGEPLVGATETFISIGNFKTKYEAESCFKYIKSKFTRVMLGVLKVTQDNTKEKWIYVPLQDFTPSSDIDWNKPIHEIDKQLYKKYGLDQHEINFIETNVKEMK